MNELIEKILSAARSAATVIPGMQGAAAAVAVGKKLVEIIDDLTDEAPDTRTQEEMQAARKVLAAAVSAKAERTADRFDG